MSPGAVPKKAHFVPCAYLKFFDHRGRWQEGRKARIHIYDGETAALAPVEDVGFQKWAYTKTDPEFEASFAVFETEYTDLALRIRECDGSTTERDFVMLFWTLVHFHIRNVSYANNLGVERKDLMRTLSANVMSKLLQDSPGLGLDPAQDAPWILENWGMGFVTPMREPIRFLTSDNPVKVFSVPGTDRPILMILPLFPDLTVYFQDKRYLRGVSRPAIFDDHAVLNIIQIEGRVRHAFGSSEINPGGRNSEIKDAFAGYRAKPSVDPGKWTPGYLELDGPVFSFIRPALKRSQ